MKAIVINEDNHGMIGLACNYRSAIRFLVNDRWLTNHTEMYNGATDSYVYITEDLGEEWEERLMKMGIDEFNAYMEGSFRLEEEEIFEEE